jgi:ParB-like chromosome segregation protein Spo0J
MNLVRRKLKELTPYEKNPRRNDKAVDAVVESIKQCGYVAPIIVDEYGVILAGHTRYKALKKLGRSEVEVIVREGLSEEQKRKYRLLDNKTNELAEWDFDLLADELDGLDFGGFDFGFEIEPDEAEIEGGEIEDNADKPVAVTVRFKNVKEFRGREKELREYLEGLEDVQVSVDGVNEDHESDT